MEAAAHAARDCPCLVPTQGDLGDPRATNRQDSTGAAAMVRRQYRELKKNYFLAPRHDLFGPVANRRDAQTCMVEFVFASVLHTAS